MINGEKLVDLELNNNLNIKQKDTISWSDEDEKEKNIMEGSVNYWNYSFCCFLFGWNI